MPVDCPNRADVRAKMEAVFKNADGSYSTKRLWLDTFFNAVLDQYPEDVQDCCQRQIFRLFIDIIDKEDPPYREGLKVYYAPPPK